MPVSRRVSRPPSPSPAERRNYNRAPLLDFFPRIPSAHLETLLDLCFVKNAFYNLSESKQHYNARRFTSIAIAHIRHNCTNYDSLLREQRLERYEARERTAPQIWAVLRQWCPWDDSNPALERCLRATLVRPEERGRAWDPMDVDDSDEEEKGDPMDVD